MDKGTRPGIFKRIGTTAGRFVDFRLGLIGAVVMACIVFAVNYYHTRYLFGSSTAALKQGTYTLIFGGVIMRGCEYLATRIRMQALAIVAAVLIPSAVAVSLTFAVHSMKGTPKPVESTIPTALLVVPSTLVWGFRKRGGLQVQK